MIKIILSVIGILLLVSGISELIHTVRLLAVAPKKRYNSFFVIGLKKEKFIEQLGLAYEQRRWMGDMFAEQIIAYYSDLSEDELLICRDYAKRYNIHLVYFEHTNDLILKLEEKVIN